MCAFYHSAVAVLNLLYPLHHLNIFISSASYRQEKIAVAYRIEQQKAVGSSTNGTKFTETA